MKRGDKVEIVSPPALAGTPALITHKSRRYPEVTIELLEDRGGYEAGHEFIISTDQSTSSSSPGTGAGR